METIIGYLTKDAKVTAFENTSVVNFTVARNRTYKGKDGKTTKKTKYYDCALWNAKNVAKCLTVGALVEVEGEVDAKAYAKRDGTPGASLTLRVNYLQMYSTGRAEGDTDEPTQDPTPLSEPPADDLPF